MNISNFASAELAFSYAEPLWANSGQGWFVIQTFSQPVENKTLAVWDTIALTDGDYNLHLRVFLQDGSSQDALVSNLKIRNDETPATDTPTPTPTLVATEFSRRLDDSNPLATPTVQVAPTFPLFPSPEPLPANPVSVTSASIYANLARGGFIALVVFALFSLLLRLRKN